MDRKLLRYWYMKGSVDWSLRSISEVGKKQTGQLSKPDRCAPLPSPSPLPPSPFSLSPVLTHRNLSELLENFVSDLKSRGLPTAGTDGSSIVLPSAADLFVFYKKCLVQCASLSTGPPLLELTVLFQKYLREYASRILSPSVPK